MEITLTQYVQLAKWSDEITAAAALLLNRGKDEDIIKVRRLIDYWQEHFDDISFEAQKSLEEIKNAKL